MNTHKPPLSQLPTELCQEPFLIPSPPVCQNRDKAVGQTAPLLCTGLWVNSFLSLSFLKGKRGELSYLMSILVLPDISTYLEHRTFLESQDWQRSVPTDRHGAQP